MIPRLPDCATSFVWPASARRSEHPLKKREKYHLSPVSRDERSETGKSCVPCLLVYPQLPDIQYVGMRRMLENGDNVADKFFLIERKRREFPCDLGGQFLRTPRSRHRRKRVIERIPERDD